MSFMKKLAAVAAAAAITAAAVPEPDISAEGRSMDIRIDGKTAVLAENRRYKGFGMISANNSSRLLLDYKAEHPDRYREILEYIFGKDGLSMSHLKLEMGSDINSSSGTEPNVMRREDEKADVTRGAGYQLAADAKAINPDLTLDMLWWSEPKWVTDAEDVYAARYKWYRETLVSAYETYGLEFDYVSANRNERALDTDWAVYLSEHLKADKDAPYDFSAIKIVSGEEVGLWSISKAMLNDEKLMDAVDAVGSHYTSWSDASTRQIQEENGKEVWFSEASSPMEYAQGAYRFDGTGMSSINGALDIANRIITMFPGGGMTLYEYQPAVAAYYDGVTYSQKQLILANEPWSGYYMLDSGFYTGLHFSQFIKKGWTFIESACSADGKAGGDGHAIVDSVYSYMTAADTDTGDYSTVITNTTDSPIVYSFTVSELEKASSEVSVWESAGPDGGAWNENYLKKTQTVTPQEKDGAYTYDITVRPGTIITVSTLPFERGEYREYESGILELPYSDDFEYADRESGFLASRGGAPLYTTDEGGAFEVAETENGNVLMQKIKEAEKADEWGSTPKPVTNFGDDRWYNYSVSADIIFEKTDAPEENNAGVGLRYNLADSGQSGWSLRLYENGDWKIKLGSRTISEGSAEINSGTNNIRLEAVDNVIKAYINTEPVGQADSGCEGFLCQPAGRAALYSSYNYNCFDNVRVEPAGDGYNYVKRTDCTDEAFSYEGSWEYKSMDSFKNYKRTSAAGSEGASLEIEFEGTGIMLLGPQSKDNMIKAELDGNVLTESAEVPKTGNRQAFYSLYGLEDTKHTLKVTVTKGTVTVDCAEILTGSALREMSAQAEEAVQETEQSAETPEETSESAAQSEGTESAADTEKAPESEKTEEKPAYDDRTEFPIGAMLIGAGIMAAVIIGGVLIAAKIKNRY